MGEAFTGATAMNVNLEEDVNGVINGFKNLEDAQGLLNMVGDDYIIFKVAQQSIMFDGETLAYLVLRKDVELP
jgi:hypothetical protein